MLLAIFQIEQNTDLALDSVLNKISPERKMLYNALRENLEFIAGKNPFGRSGEPPYNEKAANIFSLAYKFPVQKDLKKFSLATDVFKAICIGNTGLGSGTMELATRYSPSFARISGLFPAMAAAEFEHPEERLATRSKTFDAFMEQLHEIEHMEIVEIIPITSAEL